MIEDKSLKEKTKTIVEHYGSAQMVLTIEEMAELTQALTKYLRFFEGGQKIRDSIPAVLDNIVEEIADVSLMLLQMRMYFLISDEEINSTIKRKINRTIRSIEL